MDIIRKLEITTYSDSDYAMDPDGRKSTTGYLIYLGKNLIDWGSKKQPVVSQSSCEAELVAATTAGKKSAYLRKVLDEIIELATNSTSQAPRETTGQVTEPEKKRHKYQLYCDNIGTIQALENGDFVGRLKHIETRYYYLANEIESGNIKIDYVRSEQNPADIMTKPVKTKTWEMLIGKIIHE